MKKIMLFFKKINRQLSVGMVALAITFGAISCSLFASFSDDEGKSNPITSLNLGKSNLSMSVGEMNYVSVTIKPNSEQKNISLSWSYDESIISCDTSSNFGVTITALKEGQTSLKCSSSGYDATCLVTVSGYADNYEITTDPYIYSNTSILQTSPGVSEKIFVSLYGGDASDIDGYTWTIDNSSVATIQPTGQYCVINAKESGYSRIKVTHTKATYPYYIGVYVFEETTNVTYITTNTNILTMNIDDEEQSISVSLVNGKDSSLDSSFIWQVVNQDSDTVPIGFEYNGNKAVITPLASGSCTLRVTHPDAAYPLDILCRVITVVKNVYIQPDNTIVNLNGETQQTVTSTLQNINESEYSIDDYSYRLENYNVAEIVSSVGNQVMLFGKANGSTKLLISHPKSAYVREVLLIVTGQLTDAVDASCYITTSQNYIRTKVGADLTKLLVSLKGGEDGDESAFIWNVKSTADDGSSDVINLETTNGTAIYSRAASATYSYGTAYITPKAVGTAVITVAHPKIVYPTEILVKVLSADSILEEPLYFTGSGLIRVLNGNSYDYTVNLKGSNKTVNDDTNIKWSIDDNRLSVSATGNIANITAPAYGTGSTISHLTASHSKADADKTVLVMTADDEETLMSMKALYSDKLYYNFEVGNKAIVNCNAVGFENEDSENNGRYDFSLFTWTVNDPTVISVEKNTDYPLMCTITGLKSGSTKLTGSIVDSGTTYSCVYTITVYPVGAVQTEPEVYFTTTQNVVTIGSAGNTASVSVSAVNLSSSEYPNITWSSENTDIATVVPNGIKATITAVSEGETVINVTHADSQNTLKIYVRVGSEYVIPDSDPVVYISANDVITMLRDDSSQKLQAVLVNYTGTDTSGFTFSIDKEEIASISAQSTNGIAYIKPVGSGQAEITIRHTVTEITKKVLVVVGNSAEELAGFSYLTTSNNVVSIGEGATKTVSVSVKNAENVVVDGYTWTSSNQNIVGVTDSGATAVLTGNSIGTAIITVRNTACQYSLQIIAQVVDPIAAAANPYIQLTSSVMTLTVGNQYTSISADLVGGSESDFSDFVWSTNNSSIAVVYGQNEVGKIRAISAGTTYITVSHPKAVYSAQLLVVCDEASSSDCYISVPSSIMSMKPSDSSQTITATLINGENTDKYNFSWSLDVYDIIDFQYSANVCTITPKQTGTVTITISHPKASYDQQIIVNVQQYTEFAFPYDSFTVTQGDVRFLTMEVPTTTLSTYVEYSVENSAICTVSGTKSVVQLTAVGNGTTTVKAKLIASSTGLVQATSEMMVYVKEKDTSTVYITSSSTITTVNKGKSQTLSASLTGTGVTLSDQYNLKWTTSDSDIVQVAGIGSDGYVTGQSIYITALKSGEAIITCSHEKAASNLQFYVVVPGAAEKVITLNKSYMTLTKGSSGSTIKATIENAESSDDYYKLIWTADKVGTTEVCCVFGSGQSVTIYPLAVGETTLYVQHPDTSSVARCTIVVQATKSLVFETNTRKVQPFHSKIVNYTVSPPDAILTWTVASVDDCFEYSVLGCDSEGKGQVEIRGIKAGNGTLACVTDSGAKGTIAVRVGWDYAFTVNSTRLSGSPEKEYLIEYSVNPQDAKIDITCDKGDEICEYTHTTADTEGKGKILIVPKYCGRDVMTIRAKNNYNNDEVFGEQKIDLSFFYDKINLDAVVVKDVSHNDNSKTAYYSKIDSATKTINIGDGEDLFFKVSAVNSKVKVYSINAELLNNTESSILRVESSPDGNIVLRHYEDTTAAGYLITEGYRPTLNGKTRYPDGTPINIKDFTQDWWHERDEGGADGDDDDWQVWCVKNTKTNSEVYRIVSRPDKDYSNYDAVCSDDGEMECPGGDAWWRNVNGNAGKVYIYQNSGFIWDKERDTTLDGICLSTSEFESSLWYYCPQFTVSSDSDCSLRHRAGEIDKTNIKAIYCDVLPDRTLTNTKNAAKLCVTLEHAGGTEKVEYMVYIDTRKCACTLPNN